jgi:hypothetical protein
MGQVITVRVTVSHFGQPGDAEVISLTPTAGGTGNWSGMLLQSYSYVAASGSSIISPLNIFPGDTLTIDLVMSVTATGGAVTGDDTVTVTLGGLYTDDKLPVVNNRPITPTATAFTIVVAPTTAVSGNPVHNEIFLSANFFNPPYQSLIVYFTVASSGHVTIRVYNIAGELVKTLYNDQAYASSDPNASILYSGNTDPRLVWDGTADDGQAVTSGTYLILIDTGSYKEIKKVNLLR